MITQLQRSSTEDAFNIMGIEARSSNKAEKQGAGIIAALWKRFFVEDILSKIPHKTDDAIMVLYTDYETDKDGEYTVIIGARTADLNTVPYGLTARHIRSEKRLIFLTQTGPVAQVVIHGWERIWELEDSHQLCRAYEADYEIYDSRAWDSKHAQVAIHVGGH